MWARVGAQRGGDVRNIARKPLTKPDGANPYSGRGKSNFAIWIPCFINDDKKFGADE
jgi:hypothetical protein